MCVFVFSVAALLWNGATPAQDLMLPKDAEVGFQRLIHMAQTGQLGDDVTNANVGVFKTWVQLELVRGDAAKKVFFLTPKSSPQATSRYFDIRLGEGATASDVARIGSALDEVFGEDPFQLTPDFYAPPAGALLSSLLEGWRYGGWRGLLRVSERRMAALTSLRYTIVIIIGLAAGLLASLLLLWGSLPPTSHTGSSTDPSRRRTSQ